MNTAASIRARLLNASRKTGESFQSLLVRYAIERFLYRLGRSEHRDAFLLKGAMLFVAWGGRLHRPTKDLDLLGFGDPEPGEVAARIAGILAVPCDDGMIFDAASIQTEPIKEEDEYRGVRVLLIARLEQARASLQIDVGFGDAVNPQPLAAAFPAILERVEPPLLRMYPPETVVAEKVQAMVALDIRNSRMKDFYDFWFLSRTHRFQRTALSAAFAATFECRRTPLPDRLPFALTKAFLSDSGKLEQWAGFVRRLRLEPDTPGLPAIGEAIATFVAPVFTPSTGRGVWPPGGPWQAGPNSA